MNKLQKIYCALLDSFGPQGWWPLVSHKGSNPTKTGSVNGYHPTDYVLPKTTNEIFEVCIGAILTQNTGWPNVENALLNLNAIDALSPEKLIPLDDKKLKFAIRPAGYFNQKAKKLIVFSKFFSELNGKIPSRAELLSLWGVGNETADSILLYAFKNPLFVVDAYTKRVFSRIGLCKLDSSYEEVQQLFHESLPADFKLFNEYHALIVELAKRNCAKNSPKCDSCPVQSVCRKLF